MAKNALLIISVTEIFDYSRSVLEGSLRDIEKTCYAMMANLATIWCIGAPISYLLGFQADLDLNGIFIGRGIGIVLGFSLLLYKWIRETSANQVSASEESQNSCSLCNCLSFFSHKGGSDVNTEPKTSTQYEALTI